MKKVQNKKSGSQPTAVEVLDRILGRINKRLSESASKNSGKEHPGPGITAEWEEDTENEVLTQLVTFRSKLPDVELFRVMVETHAPDLLTRQHQALSSVLEELAFHGITYILVLSEEALRRTPAQGPHSISEQEMEEINSVKEAAEKGVTEAKKEHVKLRKL